MPVPGSVFISGGTLTLGTLTPGLDVAIAMGDFIGYIDEVRIWDRPHNPTIITQNRRVVINSDTADVSHSWTFNEGIGLTAKEDRKGESFIVDDALNPPTWQKSDLDLSSDKYLKAPTMTTELPVDMALLDAAIQSCDNLIDSFSLSTGSSNIDGILAAFKALCIQEVQGSNDTSQAESILASAGELYQAIHNETETPLASMCNNVSTLVDYIGFSGDSCTECKFGTVTAAGCECFETHWGVACDNICPVGPLGACNTYGVCDSAVGGCNCFSRYHGTQTSAVLYWSNFITSSSMASASNYSCDTCADGWVGLDCSFAQATPVSTKFFVALTYGSYITTLDSVSLTFITPGVYRLLQTTNVEIQVLFVPCLGAHLCRHLQEISFKDSQSTISIQYVTGGNITVLFDGEALEYPMSKSSASISLDWSYMFSYPRIKFGSSSILVFSSSFGLVSAFKLSSSDSGSTTGLLGNSDGNWVSDLNCATSTQSLIDNESNMFGGYVGECIRDRYTPPSAEIFIQHELGLESLTSAGFVLHLEAQTLTLSGYPIQTGLPKFTLAFWTKVISSSVTKRSTTRISLFQTNTGSHDLEFISNSGELEIDWDQLYQTNKSFAPDKWTYVVFTWSDDGEWSVYLITKDEVIYYPGPTAMVGGSITLGDIIITGTAGLFIEVDYIRAWSDGKTLDEAVADMKIYSTDYSTGLLLTMVLDEGTGLTPSILTFASNGTVTYTAASISGKIIKTFIFSMLNLTFKVQRKRLNLQTA